MPVVGGGSTYPTAAVSNFASIYTEILNRMRQPTNVAAIVEQAKRYANTALFDIVLGFEYQLPWLERHDVLRVRAPYTTGTVSVNVGSTTVTGVSTLWTTADSYGDNNARVGGKISFGDQNIYTVTAVGGAGTITLNTKYVATANLSAGTYTYFEDEYALASDFLKPISYTSFTGAYDLPIIGRNDFRRQFPRPNISGKPTVATLLDDDFVGNQTEVIKVQFYPYPNAAYLLPYTYVTRNLAVSETGVEQEQMSADNDVPMLPLRYRQLIVLQAISQWYRDKKDDARATVAQSDYGAMISRLVNDQRIGTNTMAKITPRVGMYTTKKIYSGRSNARRFSTNNSFDEFRT
jgi:hypothetical protein